MAVLAMLVAPSARAADLEARTVRGFDRYIQALETRTDRQQSSPQTYLDIQNLVLAQREEVYQMLQHGDPYIAQLHERTSTGQVIHVPGGWIHHFVGTVYVPNATVREALAVLEDFDHYEDFYRPEILRSKILRRDRDGLEVYLRLQKHAVVTLTLNMNEEVEVSQLDRNHAALRTHSTRIAQVEDYGTPSQHEDPPDDGSGFVWRMNTYWRIEKWWNGVILESETVVLSRTMPFALRWFVGPLVARVSQATVRETITATRDAISKVIAEDNARAARLR